MKATVEAVLLFVHEFMKIHYFIEIFKNGLSKNRGHVFGGKKKSPAGILPVAPSFKNH